MDRLFSLVPAVGMFLVVALVGCSGGNRFSHNSPQEAFEKGMEQFKEEDYERAVRYFRAVFNYGRGNEWAPDAQFQLATAQQKRGKHLVAANEFQRFRQLYRNDPRVPRAEYQQALAYYKRSPMYRLDQTDTREALRLFQLFIDRNPGHKLVSDAEKKVVELRRKLAHKRHAAAAHYEKREMWPAATEVYEDAFDQYSDTEWADDALLGAIRTYVEYADRSVLNKQPERYQKALDHYARLEQLFPNSPLMEDAKELRAEAERKRERALRQQEQNQSLARGGTPDDDDN